VSAGEVETAGVVVIGRNEGERLKECLESVIKQSKNVIYVDSGSIDGSPNFARGLNVDVVELDPSVPFSAARARNAGFARLVEATPELKFVQFVDGDCELVDGWLGIGIRALQQSTSRAIVCGRLREKDPDSSIYQRLLEMEWKTEVGEVAACGGIFMARAAALRRIGGFDSDRVAGEEPELCHRLGRGGWKIERLAADMAVHKGELTCFRKWWRRSVRAGCGYAQGIGGNRELKAGSDLRQVVSSVLWGMAVPMVVALSIIAAARYPAALFIGVGGVASLGILCSRIYQTRRGQEERAGDALLYTLFCVLGKMPMCLGILKCLFSVALGQKPGIIEYKTTARP
jgi:GT2 family glycosyltransferase